MAFLIAVTGLSGAGKTTAVDYLKNVGVGEKVYFGDIVLNEVRARGLALTAENERSVRLDLRSQHGLGALAIRAGPIVTGLLNDGLNLLVDAIFAIEEYQHLQTCCGNSTPVLLAIEASFETRSRRLLSRAERPLTPEELRIRDQTEIANLGTGKAIAAAHHRIVNEESIQTFYGNLKQFWKITISSALR
jgi:dephospho-CoA kinase